VWILVESQLRLAFLCLTGIGNRAILHTYQQRFKEHKMSNVQIAVDFVNQNIPRTKAGGMIAFPMFPGATKHDITALEQALKGNVQVANTNITKKFAIVFIK